MQPETMGILLISGSHDRVHFAFMLAAGAAALGRGVVLFATNEGCRALLADWRGLEGAARDDVVRGRGVAGLEELRDAAAELGVRLIACEAGLRGADLGGADLRANVEVAGIATFLEAVGRGQVVTL